MPHLSQLLRDLNQLKNSEKAKDLSRFFKTGKGQYGEGDKFLGVMVPQQRQVAKEYVNLALTDILKLLKSKYHEHRFTALEILVMQFESGDEKQRKNIFNFYIKNSHLINNWDLVDTSAPYIVGEYLLDKNRSILYKLAKSKNIWQRRIAIVATFAFIRNNEFKDTLAISKLLLSDQHDLIHKAVGWALREVGKKNKAVLKKFLSSHTKSMPRTTLRYAIEKFPLVVRKQYLSGNF